MRTIVAAGLIALLIPVHAGAQMTARLEFESERDFATFFSPHPPLSRPAGLTIQRAQALDITLPSSGTLYVWDRSTGNMAARPVEKVAPRWPLQARDFTLIGSVTVRVEHSGQPVAAARVLLRDSAREQAQVLDASSKGEAEFLAITPGEIRVVVEYRSGGEQAPPVVQVFNVALQRQSVDPVLTVSLPQPVQTLGGTSAAGPAQTATTPKRDEQPARPIGSIIVYIVALAAAIAGGYWLLQVARNNPKKIADAMGRIGVPVPEPSAPPDGPDAPPPSAPSAPPPPQKIILDDAAPDAVGVPSPGAAVFTEPRLVKGSGEFVVLDEGETVVGREDGLGLSLTGESSVSRRHAAVIRTGAQVIVRDLGSTNGTYVNGRKVEADTTLSHGDEVQFGAVRFRLES